MKDNAESIEEQRWLALSPIMSAMRTTPSLRWANPLDVKNVVEKALETQFGPKGQQPAATKAPKESKAPARVSH